MEVKKTSKYFVDLVESMKEDYTNLQSSINNQHNSYKIIFKWEKRNFTLPHG